MRKKSLEKGFYGDPLAEINITPLADVSLTLIIMLMTISPIIVQSMIKILSNKAVSSQEVSVQEEKTLILDIKKDAVYLNTKKVDTEINLAVMLANELSRKNDKTVIVTADPDVLHGQVVRILDIAKQNGAKKLSLVKKKNEKV